MIVDCFTFSGEFDMLELRLRTLDRVVDRFVLCEAPFTFRGEPKPLSFREHAGRFARWHDRIDALVYPGPPSENPWLNEWGQRDFLATGLAACAPDDLILIGDCDEVPDPHLVSQRAPHRSILVHRMLLARGFVNRIETLAYDWPGTRAIAARDIARIGTFSDVRKVPLAELDSIESGWHFSSLGDASALVRKMQSYSHAEYDVTYYRDVRRLTLELATGGHWVPLDERFPASLRDDARWAPFVAAEPLEGDEAHARQLAHAHGCLAYLPHDARAVAVLSANAELWRGAVEARAGNAVEADVRSTVETREGVAFAGVFADAAALVANVEPGTWALVDGLESSGRSTLATLRGAALPAVVFAANARSFEVFQRVVSGHAGFGDGRALGAAECAAEITAAGYRVTTRDRVFSRKLSIPYAIPPGYDITLGSFSFHAVEPEAFFDFLAEAFVFTLGPKDR